MDDIYSKVPKYSCKDCTKRHPGCHSKCEGYLAAKKVRDDANKERAKSNTGFITAHKTVRSTSNILRTHKR